MTAPSGTTPWVAKRHKAINSFRASATTMTFRMRHDGPSTRIQGGVAVVRPDVFASFSKSGAALLELSRPECGTVVRTQSRRM